VRTLYLVDRVVLRDRRLPCRKGLIFVAGEDGSPWHAVIYDPAAEVLEVFQCEVAIPFGATTPEGLWLEGTVKLGHGDHEMRVHYLRGLGKLAVSGETVRALPDAASWKPTRLRRVS